MKILILIFSILILTLNVASGEDANCDKYSKVSKKYLSCKANELKKITQKNTKEISKKAQEKTKKITKKAKEKTNNLKEKIDLSDTKSKIQKIKESKTLKELFKKKND